MHCKEKSVVYVENFIGFSGQGIEVKAKRLQVQTHGAPCCTIAMLYSVSYSWVIEGS